MSPAQKPTAIVAGRQKIKILRIIARLNIGGSTVHVVNLAAGLDPSYFEQILVSGTENPGEGSMIDYVLSHHVRPVIIPEIVGRASITLGDLRALSKLYELIRREQPHIVETHTAKAGLLGRWAAHLARVPVVVHTYHGHVLRGYYGSLKSSLLRQMERSLARITDCIIAVSEQVKHDLVSYGICAANRIVVIPYGFDLDPFFSSFKARGQFRQELGFESGVRLVGIVGRIFPIKNHGLFLDAAARVAWQDPATRFVIVGDGILRAEMEERSQELGIADRVVFTGWRRDLPSIYADLDVLVISSDNEGAPFSAIEAMASGRPVVATGVGGLPDLVRDGETGYLVPPRDPKALADAILRVLGDPETANRMGQAGRAIAQERFTAERLISDMQNLYEELLARKGMTHH